MAVRRNGHTAPPVAAGLITALAYIRVSKEEQAREGLSVPAQLAAGRRYSAQRGWVLGREFVDVETGKRDDRTYYQAMLAEIRTRAAAGERLAVVVIRLDRLGRHLLERVRCWEELKALGVPVHSVNEGGEVPELVANILASVAQEESRLISERTSFVKQHQRAQGWHVGQPPWGYLARRATPDERADGAPYVLAPDPDTAPYLREAFARAAAGQATRQVAAWARTLPPEARGGRRLPSQVVSATLRSALYLGCVQPDGPTRWPPLLSRELWEQVQARLDAARVLHRQASGRFLLTGFIRCPWCGGRLFGWTRRRGPYRRVTRHYFHSADQTLHCLYAVRPASALETDVLAQVLARLAPLVRPRGALRAALGQAWRRAQQQSIPVDAGRARAAEVRMAKARERLAEAAILLVDGALDRDGYDLLRAREQAALEAASAELDALGRRRDIVQLPPLEEMLRAVSGWAKAIQSADVPAQRDVLARLVVQVVPVRLGRSVYRGDITWTALGAALEGLGSAGLRSWGCRQ